MDDRADNETTSAAAGPGLPYEAPVLTPIGSLGELLAGQGSNVCDAGVSGTGPDPAPSCME
jgi:hypothetical protein